MLRRNPDDRTPLLRSRSTDRVTDAHDEEDAGKTKMAGGTILGVHNLAIVMPQFVVSPVFSSGRKPSLIRS